jgi:ferritin
MFSKKMETELNRQINLELFSSYMYLALSAFFSDKNLAGFANWMRVQADEEQQHAYKLFDYVIDREGKVKLSIIKAPPSTWRSTLDACQAAYKAEVHNTKQINELMDLAFKEKDHATRVILQWFIEEQVEEEASAKQLVDQVKLAADSAGALFMLDRELGQRQPEGA